MGKQIVKQPNGKFAIWSSVIDDFVFVDASVDEIIEDMVASSRRQIDEHVRKVVDMLERGEKPCHQFTKSFAECVDLIKTVHGEGSVSLSILNGDGAQ
jgi:predicted DNA-binding protein YlxM (UPF0122 family)